MDYKVAGSSDEIMQQKEGANLQVDEIKTTFEPQDYVRCQYYGETLNGRILSIDESSQTAEVEICLSSKRGEQMLNDIVVLGFNVMKKIKYVPKNNGDDDD